MDDPSLSALDRAVLDFERTWWCSPGSKETRIRDELGVSATQFYRRLALLTDDDAALAYDPLTVKRLRLRRATRRRARYEGRESHPGYR